VVGDDGALTLVPAPLRCRCQRGVSAMAHAPGMNDDGVAHSIRRAIGGDGDAIAWVAAHGPDSGDAILMALAAVLERDPAALERARTVAGTTRQRQVVEIARAHLDGAAELVDALARDHLVDHPDSLIVAWIASHEIGPDRQPGST
jgi:hypothetical protein